MSDIQPKLPNCPFCWDHKHKCLRDVKTARCERCDEYLKGFQVPQTTPSEFYDAKAHAELYKALPRDSLSSLDITPGSADCNILEVQITTAGRTSLNYVFDIDGPFSTLNSKVVSSLETMIRSSLVPALRGRDPSAPIFDKALLAIGSANLLCSTVQVEQQITTMRDGLAAENDHQQYSLDVHFQYLILSYLRERVKECLEGIQFEDPGGEFRAYTTNAFAGGVVLRYYLDYLRRSLKNGDISKLGHMPDTFRRILIRWFESVVSELSYRIRRGCGQYPDWQTAIVGSLKDSRHNGDTIQLNFTLRQIKYITFDPKPADNIYVILGSGNCYLLPPCDSTM